MIEGLHDSHVRAWINNAAFKFAKMPLAEGFKRRALHEYTDADGAPLYWRIRLKNPETGAKWIRPMSRVGGKFELKEPTFENGKPLYGLHHIASNPAATVWIVEGEQKADALAKLGLLAMTSGGATSADTADWQPLRGRIARIWPDNDVPGKAFAGEVANILLGMGCDVSCIDVEKLGLGIGEDVIEWLAAHPGAMASDVEALSRVDARLHGESSPSSDSWPDPLPLPEALPPVTAFDFALLPNALRPWIQESPSACNVRRISRQLAQ